jgi:hypothetical protein
MIRPIFILLALTLPAIAQSATSAKRAADDTREFVDRCRVYTGDTDERHAAAIRCLSYIQGFKDGLAFAGGEPKFCVPPRVLFGDEVAVFVRWANQHPDSLGESKQATLMKFYLETYPCPK